MAHANCTRCGKEYWWPAGRGHRLQDSPSRCCGSPGKATRYGNRGASSRHYPTIMADYWWLDGTTWRVIHGKTVKLMKDGIVQFRRWYHRGQAGDINMGMRQFRSLDSLDLVQEFMLRESDYQRLLAKSRSIGTKAEKIKEDHNARAS
mgnify:CR=1 FL=1